MDLSVAGADGIIFAFAHTPPGAIGNQVILPLAIVMLALALWSGYRREATA